jgi:hypothetical protein
VDLGLAPRPLVGVKLEAEYRTERLSLALDLRWDPTAEFAAHDTAEQKPRRLGIRRPDTAAHAPAGQSLLRPMPGVEGNDRLVRVDPFRRELRRASMRVRAYRRESNLPRIDPVSQSCNNPSTPEPFTAVARAEVL